MSTVAASLPTRAEASPFIINRRDDLLWFVGSALVSVIAEYGAAADPDRCPSRG